MITNVSISRGGKEQFFSVGGKVMNGEKETDIEVKRILMFMGMVIIYFSDGTSLIFKGFPYSYAKTNPWWAKYTKREKSDKD
jgi:hypothetical protein